MRIDCKHVWEHISAYIDGEVDASLRADIDRHLETCEICSAVLDSTRNVVILVADDRVFEFAGLHRTTACADREGTGSARRLRRFQIKCNSRRSCTAAGVPCGEPWGASKSRDQREAG